MFEFLDVMQLDGAHLILQHHVFDDALDLGFLTRLRKGISDQRSRRAQGLLEKVLVVVVGQDSDAFCRERRESPGVIEMRVLLTTYLICLFESGAWFRQGIARPASPLCPPSSTINVVG